MTIAALLATSRFSYDAGTAGTVTVPSGKIVVMFTAASIAGGSMTIAPGGPNQPTPSAGSSIPIPAGIPLSLAWEPGMSPLGGGTVFVFTSTDSYLITYAQLKVG